MNDKEQIADGQRAAIAIIKALRAEGFTAVLAGGCVRDRLLGLEPKDYDVASDAPPASVQKLFPRCRSVGAKFGVMLVGKFGIDVEVATFRTDGDYSDGRHPDRVSFGTLIEDAGRRDFTINGLFFDPINDELIDHVDGQADLAARVIRTIGDPNRRFSEDHLRMLRAVRFAARFDFDIDPATLDSIKNCASSMTTISPERIWMELELILTSPARAQGWRLLAETGLRPHLADHWPTERARDQAALKRLRELPAAAADIALSLAAVLCDWDAAEVAAICLDLRLSNRLSKAVTWLVKSLAVVNAGSELELADLKCLMAADHWPELLELIRVHAVAAGTGPTGYGEIKRRAEAIPSDLVAPPPLLTGEDLVNLDVKPGPQFGQILDAVYRVQLNESIGTRDEALTMAKRMLHDDLG